MNNSSTNRRKVLKTLGAASIGAVGASGVTGAESNGANPYEGFPSKDSLTTEPITEVAFQIAENAKQNKIAFSAFTEESGMGIFLANGVKDSSEVPNTVKQLSDAPYVYA